MSNLIEGALNRLGQRLSNRLSRPGDEHFVARAIGIWAKPAGQMPRAVAHCRTPQDVQLAIRSAREAGLPLPEWYGQWPMICTLGAKSKEALRRVIARTEAGLRRRKSHFSESWRTDLKAGVTAHIGRWPVMP